MKFKKMIYLIMLKTILILLTTITLGIPKLIKKIKDKIALIESKE